MTKQKVNAYTILEVAITMLIASILIGITYTAYSIITRSFISYNKKNDDMAVLNQLDLLLKRDFAQSEIVIKNSEGISLNSSAHMIKYVFTPDFITREDIRTDTFKVRTENVIISFEDEPLNEVYDNGEQNRADDMAFSLLFNDEKIPYHYHKQYSSVNLINRKNNAVN